MFVMPRHSTLKRDAFSLPIGPDHAQRLRRKRRDILVVASAVTPRVDEAGGKYREEDNRSHFSFHSGIPF
jgi:hypothetical protein